MFNITISGAKQISNTILGTMFNSWRHLFRTWRPFCPGCITSALKSLRSLCPGFLQSPFPHGNCFLNRELTRKRPFILPHPDVDFEETASSPTVWPWICSCLPWNSRPEAVWNGIERVAIQVTWNQRHTSQNILSNRPLVQHGNTFPLHAAAWSQASWLKCVVKTSETPCLF
jgi:hypothetical protein